MPIRFLPVLAWAAWLPAATAMAQASPAQSPPSATPPSAPAPETPTPVSPLTVPAPPTSRAVLEKQAHRFVEAYAAPTTKLDQYARWNEPACVAVTGLIPEQADQIRKRVEDVAKTVGEPVARSGCKPNIEIAFTTEPQRYVDAVGARNLAVLGHDGPKTVTRPIQSWYATTTLGQPGPARGDDLRPSTAPPPASIADIARMNTAERARDTRELGAFRRCIDVHSPTCPHSGFLNVLVVVDAGHMGDVSLDLTSDYVAMLALSQPRSLDGCLALPSVTDLYASACPGRDPPSGLTAADMAYLTSLYAADLTLEKSSEQSDIAGRMAKILASAQEPAR